MRKTLRLLWLSILLGALVPGSGWAQHLEIVSTDPAEGAAGVPQRVRITFAFNLDLPQLGFLVAPQFTWSPTDAAALRGFGQDPEGEGDLSKIYFDLEQDPATDVAFFVFGVRSGDGRKMARPFVLNYTTAATPGAHRVSGTVALAERTLTPPAVKVQPVLDHLQRLRVPRRLTPLAATHGAVTASLSTPRAVLHPLTASAKPAQQDLTKTVVLLMERYELDDRVWRFHYAATVDAEGAYAFDNVRDGTYWPVAIHFADDDGETIGAYGFYDADGDLEPDSIDVDGGSVEDVALKLFTYGPITSGAYRALADDLARQIAADHQLVDIRVLRGPGLGHAYADGTAMLWRYTFYSATEHLVTYIAIDPINVYIDSESAEDYAPAPLPVDVLDSEAVIQIVDEEGGAGFKATYPEQDIRVFMQTGDITATGRPETDRPLWLVEYQSPEGAQPDSVLRVFLDAESGALLGGTIVATEAGAAVPEGFALAQNYPNPFNPETTIRFTLPEATAVRLTVYDLLGREVIRLIDAHLPAGAHEAVWEGRNAAGQTLPSGTYLYRLEAGSFSQTRRMVLLK